jgi:hypothetical protein
MNMSHYSNLFELPFLLISVYFAFLTAQALKGGAFGKGMLFIAYGSLVMAIGHSHMLADSMFGFNLFNTLFGETLGQIIWVIALIVTWVLTGYGFYCIYRASKTN